MERLSPRAAMRTTWAMAARRPACPSSRPACWCSRERWTLIVTGTAAWLLAHQGGWDELLFVLVPIGLFGGLLAIANRRAAADQAEHDAGPRRRGVTTLTRTLGPEDEALARQPRDDLVAEVLDGADRFTARGGPFSSYERTLDDRRRRRDRRDHPLRAGADGVVVAARPPVPHGARPPTAPRPPPWWSPPEAPDRRGSTALGALCYLGARLRVHRHPAHPDDHLRGRRVRRQQDRAGRGAVARAHRGAGRPGGHDPRRPARAAPGAARLRGDRLRWSPRCPALAPDLITARRGADASCGAAPPPAGCSSASWPPRRCRRARGPSRSRCSPPPARSGPASASWRSRSPTRARPVGGS